MVPALRSPVFSFPILFHAFCLLTRLGAFLKCLLKKKKWTNQQDSKSIYSIIWTIGSNKMQTLPILIFQIKIVSRFHQSTQYLIAPCPTGDLELHILSVHIYEFFINDSDWNWIGAWLRRSPIVYVFSLLSRPPTIQLNLSLFLCFCLFHLQDDLLQYPFYPFFLYAEFNNEVVRSTTQLTFSKNGNVGPCGQAYVDISMSPFLLSAPS